MDTKSKNRHSLGIWLVIGLILVVSAATVRLYPYMQNRAESYRLEMGQSGSQGSQASAGNPDELAREMITTGYVACWEMRQEWLEKALTASQVFVPGLGEKLYQAIQEDNAILMGEAPDHDGVRYTGDYYQNAQETVDQIGRDWKKSYQKYRTVFYYQLLDSHGVTVRSNVKEPEAYFETELKPEEIQLVLSFQMSGGVKLQSLEGDGCDLEELRLALETYEFYNPLEGKVNDYQYSGVDFIGPGGMQIRIRCNPAAFSELSRNQPDEFVRMEEVRDFLMSGGYHIVILVMCVIVLLAAVILPSIRGLELGRSAWCRLALEPLLVIAVLWGITVLEGGIYASLVVRYLDGSLLEELAKAELKPETASALALAVQVGFWAAAYGILYWMALCIRPLFTMGIGGYLRERSWIGRGIARVSNGFRQGLAAWKLTDWTENSNKIIRRAVIWNFVILSLITTLWLGGILALAVYSVILFFVLKKYSDRLKQSYKNLEGAVGQIAAGELDAELTEDFGVFDPLKEQLLKIQTGLKEAVAQEVKSERTKAELITNVSHDLKTPLTAIITYVNLLKQENLTKEERESYVEVLDQKSMRLKSLIEDLFEVTKANSGSISLHMTEVDVVSLLKQVHLELSDKIAESDIEFRFQLPEEKVILTLDGQKTYRIFENLMVNILKYAMPGTRAYLEIRPEETGVTVSMRNVSARELSVSPEELTERFVRGDESRNTDGSGLGLAIARAFVEAQGGSMSVRVEDDVFKVTLFWKYPEA